MNCNKKEDQLLGYFLNTLNPAEREDLEIHLPSCQSCQRRLGELEKVRGLFRQWKSVIPPPDLKQKVLDNIRAQKLIEEKTSQESLSKNVPTEKILEWLKKRVNSEQIRIYNILTDFLGKEKGEEVFDYYLEEDLKEQMSVPPEDLQIITKSLGLDTEVRMLEGGVMKETVRNCSYFTMAKEFGMKVNPCEVICLKMAKLREKIQPVKAELIKKLPNKEGECIFLFTPLSSTP
jgi:hypothetical protein